MATKPDAVDEALADMPVKNLRGKLAYIRERIPNIEKAGKGPKEQGSYKYMRAEDLCGDVGDLMCLMGISMIPETVEVVCHEVIEVTRANGNIGKDVHVIIVVMYRFVDADSDEHIFCSAVGEGRDTSDKATNKAMTGAKKYALSQALTMRVGDDSEADETQSGQEHQPAPKTVATPAQTQPAAPSTPHPQASNGLVISDPQGRRLYAIAQGNKFVLAAVLKKFGYEDSRKILRSDYEKVCAEVQRVISMPESDRPQPNPDDSDIPF